MSLAHSPSIVTNGLVFAYDMANTKKSWKGAPTVNQFSIPTPDGSGYVTFPVNGTGTFQRIYTGTYGGYTIQPTDIVYKYVLGAAPTGCHYHGNDVTITAGVTATWSCDFYIDPSVTGYPVTNYLANFEGVVSGSAADPDTSKTGVWKSFTFSSTAGSTGLCRMLLYPGACGTQLATGGFILYKNPQVEFNPPGSAPTPFVAGTRSNTQSILDLTNNNTVTVNSLTYSSDGTFSFNGSSNSLTIPFNSGLFTFNSEQTIIIWMKNNSPSSARRNPYNMAYAGAGTITHENDGAFNYYYGTGGGDNSPYTNHTSPFSVVVGETAMICITRNTSQTAWYKNGTLGNTQSNPYGTVVTGTNYITLGSGYAGAFGGNLYNVQIYNRALSAVEVQQNFNALRGRYGI